MKRKVEPPDLVLKFHQVSDERWVCYDIDDLKIEVEYFDDKTCIAAATFDDELGYSYGHEFSEVARHRVIAMTALMGSVRLPYLLSLADDPEATFYHLYPTIEFQWGIGTTGTFETERILPQRKVLFINLLERDDNSWLWRGHSCRIEVVPVEDDWLACATPIVLSSETVYCPSIDGTNNNRDEALAQLLDHKDITKTLGLSIFEDKPLGHFYDAIRIRWFPRRAEKVSVAKPVSGRLFNTCSWQTITDECDGSFDCNFCGSHGSGYFMRWDD